MVQLSTYQHLALFKDRLSAIPHTKLVEILAERSVYDDSLRTFLDIIIKAEAAGGPASDLFEAAKTMISQTYGVDTLNYQDASYYAPELYAVHSVVERLFANAHYQCVIDLLQWSLQFEENLAGVSWPDDFMDTAYMPLAILSLKSHLQLGKTPTQVAEIYRKLGDVDKYGLFYKLPYLRPEEEAELALVRKELGNVR